MFDFEIAFVFYKISKILAIFEGNKYKSEAYYRAAMAIDAYDTFISDICEHGNLQEIAGIGKSIEKTIIEILHTGKCKLLSDLENKYNIKDYSLILVNGLSNKITARLFECGITTFDELCDGLKDGVIERSFKKIELEKIRSFEVAYKSQRNKYLFSYGNCLGSELVDMFENNCIPAILQMPWAEKIEKIIIEIEDYNANSAFDLLTNCARYEQVIKTAEKITCNTIFGIPVEIHFGEKLSNQSSYKKILNGDLHMHTTWSDGIHSIETMAARAKELGCKFIGITDHSYSLRVANGISEIDAQRQIEEIHNLKLKGIKVLAGIEVEVLEDGSLDFSDAVLSQFDYVIAGIHTFLDQPYNQLFSRIEKALSNPYVNIFAHPTSRLLGRPGVLFSERSSYAVSERHIIELCQKYDVAIEFNAFPERFDITPEFFATINEHKVMLSVGTDSHSAAHLSCLRFAESALKEKPISKTRILNCFSYKKLLEFFRMQREKKVVKSLSPKSEMIHDFNYFFGNNAKIINGESVVIGIDLTGSEAKPSGWSVLRGNKAETKMIFSDDELISESMRYAPGIISIDSPLSLPEGRCCTNANCQCAKYGITRYCERLLFAFGIGVYPCLIPSMVNLTSRGIKLAEKFRALGVEVIESYPGAAQDILSIRRKQNGLQHLKNGYKSFGLEGNYFSSVKIKHDELDAIMSALVGLFYINDQYVALGKESENYLIIPQIAPKDKSPIVIGLTGGISSGKTTLAEYLKFKHGFLTFRYSDIICKLYNCKYDRKILQKLGEEISKDQKRQEELSELIISEIQEHSDKSVVVDGLRHELDYEMLNKAFGDRFKMLYIESTFSNSYKRYNKRLITQMTKEEFRSIYDAPSENEIISLLMSGNAIRIENNKTYKAYFDTVEELLRDELWL